ncbi:hypothetical protein [Streptomyces roseicoloratus]|uniref:hypothetical protein n=1 Tax=Streptomyces roseicoloratus TaxID=2508722 RepID=UPI001009AC08|nr:hypothetical protein [Streptomyces roseicoloratus]
MEYVKRYGTAAVLAAVVAVTGCGTSPAAPPDDSGLSVPPTPGTPTPGTPTPGTDRPAPQEVLVEVVVNGGFAGVRNKLVVHYDGSYELRKGTGKPTSGRMTEAQAAELRAALEDPAYAKVPDRPTGSPAPDGFEYSVTHAHRVVVTRDGEDRPPALDRVFRALPGGHPPTAP